MPDPTSTPSDAELRHLAGLLEWGGGDEPWGFDPTAGPDSAYAVWVRLLSPATVVGLLDRIDRPELSEEAMEAALVGVWLRMQRGDMSAGGPNSQDMRHQWARSVIGHYQALTHGAQVAPTTVGGNE